MLYLLSSLKLLFLLVRVHIRENGLHFVFEGVESARKQVDKNPTVFHVNRQAQKSVRALFVKYMRI